MSELRVIRWLIVAACALLLFGCGGEQPTPAPTAVPASTATPRATSARPTATLTVAPSASPAVPTPTVPPPIATTKIIVNVRAGPSASYPLLGKLKKGERRAILGKSEDSKWWQIDYEGRPGWIPADFTDVQGGTNLVAVISVAPAPTSTPLPTRVVYGGTPAPKPTATAPPPPPLGRIYFLVQDQLAWMRPQVKDQVFFDIAVGTPSDIANADIDSRAAPFDWSDAAGKLVYVFGGPQDTLHIKDQTSDRVIDSHEALLTPRWSGDGRQVWFVGYDKNIQAIYVINADRSKPGNYHCFTARSGEQLRGLAVNPRSGDIAFVSNYSGRFEIWKMDRFCNGVVKLTSDDADDSAPAFSRDGSRLAYVSNKLAPTDHEVYLMAAVGGTAVQLGEGLSPTFSPDGVWLAFARNLEVYIMDLAGGNVQPLTPGDRPVWAE